MGVTEALLPLSPLGMRLGCVRGTLFPLRVRLTLGAPGLPGKHDADTSTVGAPGVLCADNSLVALRARFTVVLLRLEVTATTSFL
ncbi:hypothetical protein D3C76_1483990 [compost metagenome]